MIICVCLTYFRRLFCNCSSDINPTYTYFPVSVIIYDGSVKFLLSCGMLAAFRPKIKSKHFPKICPFNHDHNWETFRLCVRLLRSHLTSFMHLTRKSISNA